MKTIKEEIDDFIHNGCDGNQLTHVGAIFGVLVEKREKNDPLIHFFIEDDGWFNYKFSVDKYWLDDLINISNTTINILLNEKK